jgi:hypothetical protein
MREVRIRDTLSGETRAIEAEDGVVGIYACGPTVYSRIHIGNARPFVVFSLLARFLEAEGYETKLVVNVTDVNDKIYAAARREGVPSDEWAKRMTRAYFEDTSRLGLGRPDAEPLATETVDGIVALIAAAVHSVPAVIVVAIFLVAYQQLENHILQPVVFARTVKLNPLAVLIAILFGVELAGILGALLGIPVAGIIQVIARDVWDRRRGTTKAAPTTGEDRTPLTAPAP